VYNAAAVRKRSSKYQLRIKKFAEATAFQGIKGTSEYVSVLAFF